LELHVRAATDTKAAYLKQFNIGRRTLLDLLNTENELVDARRALINASYDKLFSQYRIFNSMGQLVREIGVGKS
jgi:adhesin transport system outer membrane protein